MALQPWILVDTLNSEGYTNDLQWSHGPSAMDTGEGGPEIYCGATLQWSHGPSAMDTGAQNITYTVRWILQWSHGPSAMDTRPCHRSGASGSYSFNGAMAL